MSNEINLDNPIFAFYINLDDMSRLTANQHLAEFSRLVTYDNITSWIIPTQNGGETRVECVYSGKDVKSDNDRELVNIIKEINDRIEILGQSSNFEDFKINIRDWRINKIVDIFNEKDEQEK